MMMDEYLWQCSDLKLKRLYNQYNFAASVKPEVQRKYRYACRVDPPHMIPQGLTQEEYRETADKIKLLLAMRPTIRAWDRQK